MGHDPARAATVGVLALLLLLTAALFPVGGFGSYPAAEGTGTDGTGPAVDSGLLDSASETTTPDDETATPTPTATPTATPTPEPDDDGASGATTGDRPTIGAGLASEIGFVAGLLLLGTLLVVAFGSVVSVTATRMAAAVEDVPSGRLPRVRLFLAAIPRATVAVLVGTGSLGGTLGGRLRAALGRLGGGSLRRVGTVTRGLTGAVGAVVGGLARLSVPRLSLASLTGEVSLSRADSDGSSGAGGSGGAGSAATSGSTGRPTTPSAESDETTRGPTTVREAWARFPAYVPGVDGVSTRTPGELARRGVAAGLPDEAVETLTDAFRRVRYAGGVDESRRRAALDAFDDLRSAGTAERGDSDDSSDTDGHGDASDTDDSSDTDGGEPS